MSKIFYDHLIIREEITAELDLHAVDKEEREELLEIIDATLHHTTLNVILNHLPKEHHPEFITKFHQAPHDETLLDYLQQKISADIRSEIKLHAAKIKKEILQEIKKIPPQIKIFSPSPTTNKVRSEKMLIFSN